MQYLGEKGQAFWTGLGLRVTTSVWRPPWDLTAPDRAQLFKAVAEGWLLRAASPRWDRVWHPHQPALLQSRVVILPGRGFGLDRHEHLALVLHRLLSAGLRLSDPDPQHLQRAQQSWKAALAPIWRNAAAAGDDRKGFRR